SERLALGLEPDLRKFFSPVLQGCPLFRGRLFRKVHPAPPALRTKRCGQLNRLKDENRSFVGTKEKHGDRADPRARELDFRNHQLFSLRRAASKATDHRNPRPALIPAPQGRTLSALFSITASPPRAAGAAPSGPAPAIPCSRSFRCPAPGSSPPGAP